MDRMKAVYYIPYDDGTSEIRQSQIHLQGLQPNIRQNVLQTQFQNQVLLSNSRQIMSLAQYENQVLLSNSGQIMSVEQHQRQMMQPNYLQNISPTQFQNQEASRRLRGQKSGTVRTIGVVYCSIGALLMIIGACGIYYGAPDVPYVIPLHVAAGIMLFAAGICAYMAGQRTQTDFSLSSYVKCLMITLFALTIAGTTVCFLSATFHGVMGVVFCLGVEYSTYTENGNTIRTLNDQCTENKDGNIAFSIVIMVLSLLAAIFCIMVSCFFCKYGRIYGIKNKGRAII